jgi:DHA1 family tetracycline resistance protein-like MFS transporter
VLWKFPETLATRKVVKINLLSGVKNIKKAFSYPNLRVMFLVGFLLSIGFNFFTQFFQVFLIGKFHFSQSGIGDFFAYMGLWIAITQGVFLRIIAKKYKPIAILNVSIISLALTFPFLLIPTKSIWLYAIVPFIAILQGLTQPNTTAIISNLSDKDSQGEVLGINQSILSLSQAIPPIIAGFVTAVNINMPTIFAAVSTLLGWIILKKFFAKVDERKRTSFSGSKTPIIKVAENNKFRNAK